MPGFYSGSPSGNAALESLGTEGIGSSAWQVDTAVAEGMLADVATSVNTARAEYEEGVPTDAGEAFGMALGGQSRVYGEPTLDPAQLNAKYGIPGQLDFTSPLPDSVAAEIAARKHDALLRQDIIARSEGGFGSGLLARTAAGLVGGLPGLVDPLNLAASFVPVLPEAVATGWAARAGIGAARGAAGQAALLPYQAALASHDQEDFTASQALWELAFGGVLGGGLHTMLGAGERPTAPAREALGAVDAAAPKAREALVRGGLAQMTDGAPVDVAPLTDRLADPLSEPGTAAGDAYERIPPEPQRLTSFLRGRGGLIDQGGELGDMNAARLRPGLVNRGGMPLDDATLAAWEAGYLPGAERPAINELLDAVDSDLRGRPVYSADDAFAAEQYHGALERNAELDRVAGETGVNPRGRSREEFWNAVAARLGDDDQVALQERLGLQEDAAYDAFARARQAEGETPPGFETTEELEDGHRQSEAAAASLGSAGGARQPDPFAPDQDFGEEGAGQRGRGAGARSGADDAAGGERPGAAAGVAPGNYIRDNGAIADEVAQLERELAAATPEGEEPPAELGEIAAALKDNEGLARAIEQGGICLGRRL